MFLAPKSILTNTEGICSKNGGRKGVVSRFVSFKTKENLCVQPKALGEDVK